MIFYRLKLSSEESCFLYNIAETDPTKEYILEILHFTPPKRTLTITNTKQTGKESLQKCIEILCNNYSIPLTDIENNRNIYCPFHENAKTSKSASSKLNITTGYFTCFSSNCILPINCKTGYRQLSATQLLKKLKNDLAISECGKFKQTRR